MDISFKATLPKEAFTVIVPVFKGKDILKDLVLSDGVKESLKESLKHVAFSGKNREMLTAQEGKHRYLLIGLGDEKEFTKKEALHFGALVSERLNKYLQKTVAIDCSHLKKVSESDDMLAEIGYGVMVRDYRFDRFKSKKEDITRPDHLVIVGKSAQKAEALHEHHKSVVEGVHLTRDLLNLPPNVLNPIAFADEAKKLEKIGLKVEVLDVKDMEKLGMNSLLAVGRGSANPARLVVMQWNGGKKDDKPVAFVGKGVCFDTGGISIKPRTAMDEMKFDMGGAAVVTGLMKTLALRKAKVNAVGVIGLVENMPDGNSYRPGDILTAMSGKTIEVIDTDAEGRLVLADALWYTQDRFKPKAMIDLATLTGAVIVALGHEYCALYTNTDKLEKQISGCSAHTLEPVWHMPLSPVFAKLIESKIADVKNLSTGNGAGSITAAQFLQHFVNDTPWVHLDIAGVTWKPGTDPLSGNGPAGFGVRLLDHVVKDHYEAA